METQQLCQSCAASHRGPLCLNKSFLAQEHPPGLTLEMRPEVKRQHKRKMLSCAKFLILSSAFRFPSASDFYASYTGVQCRTCDSEMPPSIFQFCAFSSCFQLKESGQFCQPCSCTFNKEGHQKAPCASNYMQFLYQHENIACLVFVISCRILMEIAFS